MKFNLSKSNYVIFHNKSIYNTRYICTILNNTQLKLSNQPFTRCYHYTYLGIILQENLKWQLQFESVYQKAAFATNRVCSMINKNTSFHIIHKLIKMVVLPIIMYAIIFWIPSSAQIQSFNSLIVKPLRILNHLPSSTNTLTLLQEMGLPSIKFLRQYHILTYTHRCLHCH